jgi:membrane-associated phospholipid phosphatase
MSWRNRGFKARATACLIALVLGVLSSHLMATRAPTAKQVAEPPNPVLEWNQILIDTLVATNTANSSSQRLCAIVHTAIFDAYNGIERRFTPVHVQPAAPPGASRRAVVVAAAHATLVSLFPTRKVELDDSYTESLAALSDEGDDGGRSQERGIAWGEEVATAVLAWRAADGFNVAQSPFPGGLTIGQWRPTPPNFNAMSAQGLAFTTPFAVASRTQFRPAPPRALDTTDYTTDFDAVKALGAATGSTRTVDQTALAPFWEGNASVHWNQAANQIARARDLSLSDSNRLFAVLNIAMADTAFTIWSAKRSYGGDPAQVTWRPVTAIPLADSDTNSDTTSDPNWLPLVITPSHPEYPAGHPALNGAAATILLDHFADRQRFTLTTRLLMVDLPPRVYDSIGQARTDGNAARVWGGMHYPSTVAISDKVGEEIARYVNQHSMQRKAF